MNCQIKINIKNYNAILIQFFAYLNFGLIIAIVSDILFIISIAISLFWA